MRTGARRQQRLGRTSQEKKRMVHGVALREVKSKGQLVTWHCVL